jgi:hypothetical protein
VHLSASSIELAVGWMDQKRRDCTSIRCNGHVTFVRNSIGIVQISRAGIVRISRADIVQISRAGIVQISRPRIVRISLGIEAYGNT